MALNPSSPRAMARPARPLKKTGLNEGTAIVIAALLPLTQLVEIRVVGTLFLQDLLAIPLLVVLLLVVPNKGQLLRPLRLFLGLLAVWLVGAVISDIWVSSPFEDLARGWSKITLFAIHALVFWLLSGGRLKILAIYTVSTGVASIIKASVFQSGLAEIDPWKFGIGLGLLVIGGGLSVFLSGRRGLARHIPLAFAVGVAVTSLLLNSRSLFAIALLSALYSFGATFLSRHRASERLINRGSFAIVIVSGLLLSQALMVGYGQLASDGVLGEAARSKYLMQTAGNMSLLQGGRPESLVSFQAINDSPIVGHGSWARDRYYAIMYFNELKWRGLLTEDQWRLYDEGQDDLIPSHSHLFGAWVESGILGVPIWIYAIILAFDALFAVVKLRTLPSLFATITAFFVIWDVLFSPFGADARILKAAQICVLISVTYSLRATLRGREGSRRQATAVRPGYAVRLQHRGQASAQKSTITAKRG